MSFVIIQAILKLYQVSMCLVQWLKLVFSVNVKVVIFGKNMTFIVTGNSEEDFTFQNHHQVCPAFFLYVKFGLL